MHAHIVANERSEHQVSWGRAFGEGLKRHGWRVTTDRTSAKCDVLVLWGTRKVHAIEAQKSTGGEVCVLERGYLGDRFAWTSVSFGGELNGRGEFRGPFHDGSRWGRHFVHLMQEWQPQLDGYALIIGQVPGDMSLAGKDLQPWYENTAREFTKMGWPVRFRPHPVAVERGQGLPVHGARMIHGSLQEALARAMCVISWNSNTAVESVLAGVPTVAKDRGSMAWDVTSHKLSETVTPDRTAWAHRLSWCQYRREELESGFCWEAINQCARSTFSLVASAGDGPHQHGGERPRVP